MKSSREIPVRTFADSNEPAPGFLEIDFVAHGGESMQGTFLWSLVATDVCSGWTEAVALVAREQSLVVEGLGDATGVSSRQVTDPIGTVDASGNDPAALSLVAEPINPNGKLVHDLALEQVSIGHRRSRTVPWR